MNSRVAACLVLAVSLAACSSERDDPISASHTIAARVGTRDLTIIQLDSLVRTVTDPAGIGLTGATTLATIWVDYHRLAIAAARSDTLANFMDFAIAPAVNSIKVDRFLKMITAKVAIDTANEATYLAATRGLIGLRHIFISYPVGGTTAQRDSVRKFVVSLRQRMTAANFASTANRYSNDPATAHNGGTIGLIPRHLINAGVFDVVRRLMPDSISAPIETPVGLEIVQRMSWLDVRGEYPAALRSLSEGENEISASDLAVARAELTLAKYAPGLVRQALIDRDTYYEDQTEIGTYDRNGTFTMEQLLSWLSVGDQAAVTKFAAASRRIDDEQINLMIENTAARSILLRSADSAGVTVSESEKAPLRDAVRQQILNAWRTVGILPEQINTAGNVTNREALAAARVDEFLRRGLAESGGITPVSPAVQRALDKLIKPRVSVPAIRFWLKVE